jgi:hypothetical protein
MSLSDNIITEKQISEAREENNDYKERDNGRHSGYDKPGSSPYK